MTKEYTKKCIEVMQGFVNGKLVQYKDAKGEWVSLFSPHWNWANGTVEYRLKPESHYRPFESTEEVMEAIKEHGDWVVAIANDKWKHRIISYSGQRVITGYNYDEHSDGELLSKAFENYIFADGTPFGKLVEEA